MTKLRIQEVTCTYDLTIQPDRQGTRPLCLSIHSIKNNSKFMIVHLVANAMFWIKYFSLSKPGTGLSKIKGPGQLVLGAVVAYKNICRLHPRKYFQLHQEDEHQNTNQYIYQTVRAIVLDPQYNLRVGGGGVETFNRKTPPTLTLEHCQY